MVRVGAQLAVEYIIIMAVIVIVIAFLVVFFKESFVERVETNIGVTVGGYNEYLRAGGTKALNLSVAEEKEKNIFSEGVEVLGSAMSKLAGFVADKVYYYRWHLVGVIALIAVGYAAYRLTRSY